MQLEIIDILFFPILFFIGAATSWEDFKIRKIRNKWILLGLIYGIIIFSILLAWTLFGRLLVHNFSLVEHLALNDSNQIITIPLKYFFQVVINSFLALFLVFWLWRYGLVAAGDAKLFFIFSLLLPLKYYWKSYLPFFPSFALLINIYIPIFIYILLIAIQFNYFEIIKLFKKNNKINFKKIFFWLKPKFIDFVKRLVGFIIIFTIIGNILSYINPWLPAIMRSSAFLFIVFIVANRQLMKLIKNRKMYALSLVVLFVIFIFNCFKLGAEIAFIQIMMSIKTSTQFMVLFLLLRYLIDNYLKFTSKHKININELQPRMLLGIDKKVMPKIGPMAGGGLSSEQVSIIKKWCAKNNLNEIEVYKKFPFAVWVFFGVIITIIFKMSIINVIFEIMKNYNF